jgi:hypothetical protein
MKNQSGSTVTRDMLVHYHELHVKKKEIEAQLHELKKRFNQYFDQLVGKNMKGEVKIDDYTLQRQVRVMEKYEQEATISRLEELHLMELIQKKPDEEKIKSAIQLGLVTESDLEGCKVTNTSQAIYVKHIDKLS